MGKFIGLLFLYRPPLSILFLKTPKYKGMTSVPCNGNHFSKKKLYLKFVATDFSPKISSPSAGEKSGDSA